MAMNKISMAKAIVDGFKDPENPADAMKQFSDSLKKYIEDNLQIFYAWVGANPAGAPDPQVTFEATISFPSFSLSSPANLAAFGPSIALAVSGGIIQYAAGFTLAPSNLLPIPFILTESKKDNQKEAMEHVAGEIINGIKGMINRIPAAGTHAAFTGAATATTIL